jgi:peptidoglycan/LPS O-acetylase OafA/YrhL
MTNVPSVSRVRYTFVDALRGIAALGVLFFHVYVGPYEVVLDRHLPRVLTTILSYGWLGVPVFFVISGFVIGKSLSSLRLSPSSSGNFALRRQIRLDPPYWTAMAVALLSLCAARTEPTNSPSDFPSMPTILANVVYLQKILDVPEVLAVSWTLCIEIQFYVAMVFIVWGLQRMIRRFGSASVVPQCSFLVVTMSACVPQLFFFDSSAGISESSALVIGYWAMFMCGTWVQFAVEDAFPTWPALTLLALTIGCGLARQESALVAAGLTGAMLLILARCNQLHLWGRGPLWQYFGKISYSLYLVHWTIGYRIMNFAVKRSADWPVAAFAACIAAIVGSIAAAHLLYAFVERPSMELAKRLKLSEEFSASKVSGLETAAVTDDFSPARYGKAE